MDNGKLIDKNISKTDVLAYGAKVKKSVLKINGSKKFIFSVTDFPLSDPWSELGLRPAIEKLRKRNFFKGSVMELGIGDGRNIMLAGKKISAVIGVDVEEWRLNVAYYNLKNDPYLSKIPLHLYKADAVSFLDLISMKVKTGEIKSMPDKVIIILPQSRGGKNIADRYRLRESFQKYERKWDKYGLTLNAASLGKLKSVLPDYAQIVIVLSGRIPIKIIHKMFEDTGWNIAEIVKNVVVQQDPDTYLDWMLDEVPDDKKLFQDKKGNILTIKEAVKRIRKSGGDRKKLDLYHNLYIFRLTKKQVN